jgi:hypothetical protein
MVEFNFFYDISSFAYNFYSDAVEQDLTLCSKCNIDYSKIIRNDQVLGWRKLLYIIFYYQDFSQDLQRC